MLGGLHYLRTDIRMLAFFLLVTFFGVVGMGYEAMVPAYTRRIIRSGVEGYSILLACSGVGATLGAIVVASLGEAATQGALGDRRDDRVRHVPGRRGDPAALDSSGGVGRSSRLWIASGCLLGMGFGAVVFYACALTVIQLGVPDHLRGRIMGIWMIVYSGSVPLGALWTGRAALSWGVAAVMAFSASLCVVVGLVVLASGVLKPRYPGKDSRDKGGRSTL